MKAVLFNGHDRTGFDSAVSQTFLTSPGERYSLTFDAGAVGSIAEKMLRVVVQGRNVLIDTTIRVAAISAGQPFFVPHQFSFVADDDRTTLTFFDKSVTYVAIDVLLDNVRVTAESSAAPRIVDALARTAVMKGEDAGFQVLASGPSPVTYQWEFNARPIPGATGTRLVVKADDESRAGDYAVTISNTAGSVRSSAAMLTVLPAAILEGSATSRRAH